MTVDKDRFFSTEVTWFPYLDLFTLFVRLVYHAAYLNANMLRVNEYIPINAYIC